MALLKRQAKAKSMGGARKPKGVRHCVRELLEPSGKKRCVKFAAGPRGSALIGGRRKSRGGCEHCGHPCPYGYEGPAREIVREVELMPEMMGSALIGGRRRSASRGSALIGGRKRSVSRRSASVGGRRKASSHKKPMGGLFSAASRRKAEQTRQLRKLAEEEYVREAVCRDNVSMKEAKAGFKIRWKNGGKAAAQAAAGL